MKKRFYYLCMFWFSLLSAMQAQLQWDPVIDVNTMTTGNNHPRMVTNAVGHPLVLWYSARQVMFAKWNGDSFDAPVRLNPADSDAAGASWMGPDIASHGDTVYVVYKEIPEEFGHVMLMSSYDGGMTFQAPVQVDTIGSRLSRFPTVTADNEGHPVIAYMEFDNGFSNARWMVTRSFDWGRTFTPEVLASGWSSPDSDVCDCCPGAVVAEGDRVVMMYRDNNNNLRDTWAGVSEDGGLTFTFGANMDQQQWMIQACPSTGPDGVIIGDSLFSTFMNAASGMALVYGNRISLNSFIPDEATPVSAPGLGPGQQNFPRLDAKGQMRAWVWRHVAGGQEHCIIQVTDPEKGIQLWDTVHTGNIENSDVAIGADKMYVVWQDDSVGRVRMRSASYSSVTALNDQESERGPTLQVNQQSDAWVISGDALDSDGWIELFDMEGRQLWAQEVDYFLTDTSIEIPHRGWPSGTYIIRLLTSSNHFVLQVVK